MNREDIICMVQETIFAHPNDNPFDFQIRTIEQLQCFASLVADAEREACAKVCEAMRPSKEEFDQRYYAGCTDSAAAIRARGQT